MKTHSTHSTPAATVVALILSAAAFGQPDLQQPLETRFDRQAIKANNIRSVTVYADFNEDGIPTHGGYGGKLAEIEFDANGNQVYKATASNGGNLPFLEYGRGTRIGIDTFDEQGRTVSAYRENFRNSELQLNTYDANGNTSSTTTVTGSDTLAKIGFEWSDGKMTRAKVLRSNAANKTVVNDFDTEGKLARHVSGDLRQEYQYGRSASELRTTVSTYRRDSLVYTETYWTNVPSDRLTGYMRTKPSGETVVEMKAQLDAAGNAVSWFLDERTATDPEEVATPLSSVIVNSYDSRQLLTKRLYFDALPGSGTGVLTRIEWYCYDTGPLPYKLEKGTLLDRENGRDDGGDR